MARLIVTKGDQKGSTFDLHEGRNTVGRVAGNSIHLADPSVSSNHAEIVIEGERLKLRDLGSTNGTRVNGEKTEKAELAHGDEIWFGAVSLRLELKPPEPPPHSGVRMEEVGIAHSPAPEKVSSGFQKAPTKRAWPQPIVLVIGALAVILFVLLAILASRLLSR